VRDDLGDFSRLHPVVERQIQVGGQLDGLPSGDEGRERHDAAVAGGQAGTLPDIAK
jgi:hypothetical protein